VEEITLTLKKEEILDIEYFISHKSNFNSRGSLQCKNSPAHRLLQHINRKWSSAAAINTSGTARFRIQILESIK